MNLSYKERASDRRFRIFVITMHTAFALLVYKVLIFHVLGIRLPGHTLVEGHIPVLIYGAMAWLGLRELFHAKKYSEILAKSKPRFFIRVYTVVFFIMSMQMFYNYLIAGSPLLSCVRDFLVWLLPSIAAFGIKEKNWKILSRALLQQTAIACFISIFAIPLARQDIELVSSFMDRTQLLKAGGGILGEMEGLFYASFFLLLTFSLKTIWSRLFALWSVAVTAGITMIGQFRGDVISIAMAAALAWGYIPLRLANLRTGKKILHLAFVLGPLLTFLLTSSTFMNLLADSNYYMIRSINESLTSIQKRFTGEALGQNPQDDLLMRFEESQEALSEGNIFQIALGQGIGSVWSGGSLFGELRGMVHLGFGMLMFRGGIPLLILFMIFPFGIGLYVFARNREPLMLACASLIFLRVMALFVANQFDLTLSYILTLLCAGGCLMHFRDREPRLNLTGR